MPEWARDVDGGAALDGATEPKGWDEPVPVKARWVRQPKGWDEPVPVKARSGRLVGYDVFRALAICLMVVDHVTLVTGGPDVIRSTVGRLAMPAFFLLSGHLARRPPRERHLAVGLVGLILPAFVPWIDSPNVLVWWALGCVVLWCTRRLGVPVWLWAAAALTVAANGWAHTTGSSYDAAQLWGLMGLGAILPASAFLWAGELPGRLTRPLAALGRHPVAFYVGHLLALQLLVNAFGWTVA